MPTKFYEAISHRSLEAIDVSVDCMSSGERRRSEWRAFTIYKQRSTVSTVKSGIADIWPLTCPRCAEHNLMCMVTDGLNNFDEALTRQKVAEGELASTCPNHTSIHLVH